MTVESSIFGELLGNGVSPPVLSALRILLTGILAWVAAIFAKRLIRGLRIYISRNLDVPGEVERVAAPGRVFRYLVSVVVTLIAGMQVLGEPGMPVAPILGAAGVVGLAVGFGAQSPVKGYFSGFFLLPENQMCQSDVVEAVGIGIPFPHLTLYAGQPKDGGAPPFRIVRTADAS